VVETNPHNSLPGRLIHIGKKGAHPGDGIRVGDNNQRIGALIG